MKQRIEVHIADDHKILIEGIMAVIDTCIDIEIKGFSLTGKDVIKWFDVKKNKADVLVLDISMPDIDGIEVLKYFKKKKKNQKIIVLSSYDDIRIVQEVLSLGCKGYISKNDAGEHIANAIRTVANGKQFFSTDIQERLLESFTERYVPEGKLPSVYLNKILTDREIEVLKLITEEYNTIQIANLLNISTYTVETYRKSLLKKTNAKNAVGLAMFAVKNKIV